MTDKKLNILNSALELFAKEGYNGTSTKKIALRAGVSEGLIFRHFGNKERLLQALMETTEEKINNLFTPILFETNPRQVIRKTILLPYSIPRNEYDFWKLQYKLRWEPKYTNYKKIQPLLNKLEFAFDELDFKNPKNEALLLHKLLNGIAIGILLNNLDNDFAQFLLEKYDV